MLCLYFVASLFHLVFWRGEVNFPQHPNEREEYNVTLKMLAIGLRHLLFWFTTHLNERSESEYKREKEENKESKSEKEPKNGVELPEKKTDIVKEKS